MANGTNVDSSLPAYHLARVWLTSLLLASLFVLLLMYKLTNYLLKAVSTFCIYLLQGFKKLGRWSGTYLGSERGQGFDVKIVKILLSKMGLLVRTAMHPIMASRC